MLAEDISELFADAYRQAARAGANMREATPALEEIRDAISAGLNFHIVLSAIQTQIGQVELRRIATALCRFRAAYTDKVVEAEVIRLNAAFDRDADDGWRLWLTAFAELFQETAWRTRLALSLAERCLKASPDPEWPIDRVRRALHLVALRRWPETYEWYMFLSGQNLAPTLRARMLSIAAETQLYDFRQPCRAQALVDRAKSIAPDEHFTSRVQAEVYLETDRVTDAEREYRKLVERKPTLSDGYVGLAECAEAKEEAVAAEAYYKQAVLYAPGDVTSHSSLMRWYIRKSDESQALVLAMVDRLLALSTAPAEEYIDLGLEYRDAKNLAKAREMLQKAKELAPEQTLSDIWLGNCDIDEAAGALQSERLASARMHFTRDIELYPEAFDGLWGFSSIAMEEKNWMEADDWCERAAAKHPEWENVVRARQAFIAAERMDWSIAEKHVMRCLELEQHNPGVWSTLYDISEKIAENGHEEWANRLLERWRQARGEAVEYLYQNDLGLRQFSAQNYAAAIRFFEKAIAAKPNDPVLYSNAALAAENLRTEENREQWVTYAVDHLRKSQSLAPDEESYRRRLTKLVVEQRFLGTYGQQAVTIIPTVTPLRIELAREMLPSILNTQLTQLSDDTFAKIDLWKEAYRVRRGVVLPGVHFAPYDDSSSPTAFRMTIRDRYQNIGKSSGRAVLAEVLGQFERFIDNCIGSLVGHEETAALLRETAGDTKDAILTSPSRLTSLVNRVRDRLEQGMSIHDLLQLARAVLANDADSRQSPPATSPVLEDVCYPVPVFSLHSRGLRGATKNHSGIWAKVSAAVFARHGVIVPMITFIMDEDVSEGVVELRVNQQRADVPMNDRMSEADLTFLLQEYVGRQAESLVVNPLVDWYLLIISGLAPALHASLVHAFSTDSLVAGLRRYLRRGESIRDLLLVFEYMLQGEREAHRIAPLAGS